MFCGVTVAEPRLAQLILFELKSRFGVRRFRLVVVTHPSKNETVAVTGPVTVYEAVVLLLLRLIGAGDQMTLLGVPDAPKFENETCESVLVQPV